MENFRETRVWVERQIKNLFGEDKIKEIYNSPRTTEQKKKLIQELYDMFIEVTKRANIIMKERAKKIISK